MRLLLAALVAAVVLAAPARAQNTPAPTVVTFADPVSPDEFFGCEPVASGGRDGGPYVTCPASTGFLLSAPQRLVEFFIRAPGSSRLDIDAYDCSTTCAAAGQRDARGWTRRTGSRCSSRPRGRTSPAWRSRCAARAALSSTTSRIRRSTSPTRPSAPGRRSGSASTRRSAGRSRASSTATRSCRARRRSRPPGFAAGAHALRVFAIDVYGRVDASPAATTFTVASPPLSSTATATACPTSATTVPPTRTPTRPTTTRTASATRATCCRPATSRPPRGRPRSCGRSPARCSSSCPGRSLKQDGGFIPLKGVASVPVGSTVDARKGELELKSAANGFAASDRRAKQQTARIRAGLFAIRQKRAKKGVAKSASTADRHRAADAARLRDGVPEGPGEGHRALALDGRQGPLPHDRRREHRDRPQRDVRHHRPL